MVARGLKLHCDSTHLFFKITDFEDRRLGKLDAEYRVDCLGEFLSSSNKLLKIQTSDDNLGLFHPEIGRIYCDLSQSVGGLLSEGAAGLKIIKSVFGEEECGSVISASKFESEAKKKFEQIDRMYDDMVGR